MPLILILASVISTGFVGCTSRTNNEPINFTSSSNKIGANQIPVKKLKTEDGSKECLDLEALIKNNLKPATKGNVLQINQSDLAWIPSENLNERLEDIMSGSNVRRDASVKTNGELFKTTIFPATNGAKAEEQDPISVFFELFVGFQIVKQNGCSEVTTLNDSVLKITEASNRFLVVTDAKDTEVRFDIVNTNDRGGMLRIRKTKRIQMDACKSTETQTGYMYEEFLVTPDSNLANKFLFQPGFIKTLDSLVGPPIKYDNSDSRSSSKITPNDPSKNRLRMVTKSEGEVGAFPFEMWGGLKPGSGRTKQQFIDHCKTAE